MSSFAEYIRDRLRSESSSGMLIVGERKEEISTSNFSPIDNSFFGNISYIDGGEGILLESDELIASIIRTAHVDYSSNKRRGISCRDILFLGTLLGEKEIMCRLFDMDMNSAPYKEFTLNVDDELFKESKRIRLSKVSNLIRRIEELKLADELSKEYFVVMDGSLEEEHPLERKFLGNAKVMGVVKNFRLITDDGKDAKRLLIDTADNNNIRSWAYDLGGKKVLKLSSKSRFLVLFYGDDPSKAAFNSEDPIFLGYPYGLLLADRLARVSSRQTEIMKNKISCILKEDYKRFTALEENHAHNILDNIS